MVGDVGVGGEVSDVGFGVAVDAVVEKKSKSHEVHVAQLISLS